MNGVKGKHLTLLAWAYYGVVRKRWFFGLFKESDSKLRARCRALWDVAL